MNSMKLTGFCCGAAIMGAFLCAAMGEIGYGVVFGALALAFGWHAYRIAR